MIVYTVHEPARPSSALNERAEQIVFVREGFTWLGLLLPLPWLLVNRLWLEFLAAVALIALFSFIAVSVGLNEASAGLLSLLVNVIAGFEGNNLKRWKLERLGYVFLATVVGRDFEEVERRFFDAWFPHVFAGMRNLPAPQPVEPKPTATPSAVGSWTTNPVIGTLPSAGS